jgi:hypothetical protein
MRTFLAQICRSRCRPWRRKTFRQAALLIQPDMSQNIKITKAANYNSNDLKNSEFVLNGEVVTPQKTYEVYIFNGKRLGKTVKSL